MLVDVHSHYLTRALVDALAARAEPPRVEEESGVRYVRSAAQMRYPLCTELLEVEATLAAADAAGVDLALLCVNAPGVDPLPPAEAIAIARAANDELAELVRRHPGRLGALATLPMGSPQAAAAELERAAGLGLPGAMIYSNVGGARLDEPRFREVFAAAAALDAPLAVHPGLPLELVPAATPMLATTIGFLFETTTAVLRLVYDGLFDRHPELKLVVSHAGSLLPVLLGRIEYEGARLGAGGGLALPPAEAIRLLYTDTICAWPPALRLALDVFGPERVLFGSDAPFWAPAKSVETLTALALPPAVAAGIRAGNARRLFRLPVG